MEKEQHHGITILIIYIGLLIVVFTIMYNNDVNSSNMPTAVAGKLDCSNWNFKENGNIRLNGEWEFYNNQLLYPIDFANGSQHYHEYVKVPSVIKGISQGFGTYRLLIKLDSNEKYFGIKTSNIFLANRIYINRKFVGNSGFPTDYSNNYIADNVPYEAFFDVNQEVLEIIVHVANYKYEIAGIVQPITFGLEKDISSFHHLSLAYNVAIFAVLLFLALYFLSNYLMRRKDKSLLICGFYMIDLSVNILLNSEKILLQVFHNIPFAIAYKIQDISGTLVIPLTILMIRSLDQSLLKHKCYSFIQTINYSILFLLVILPYLRYTKIAYIIGGYIFIVLLLVLADLIKAYWGNTAKNLVKIEVMMLIIWVVNLFFLIFSKMLYSMSILHTIYLSVVCHLILIADIILLLSFKSNRIFEMTEQMSMKMNRMNKLKDQFLSSASNEIKIPLNGIVNMSDYLLRYQTDTLSLKQKKHLTLINAISLRLFSLVNDIQDLTQINNGELVINSKVVDLNECVKVVIGSFLYELREKDIDIYYDIKETYVMGDESRIRQVLFILIRNAIQCTTKGRITLSSKRYKNYILISIEDTGVGIVIEKQKDIFLVSSTDENDRDNGLGVGLQLSKKLIELMGGIIFLEWSKAGKGTKFTFTLPFVNEVKIEDESINYDAEAFNQYNAEVNMNESRRHEDAPTILVIGNHLINNHIMSNILCDKGFNVQITITAVEGLIMVESFEDIDLIIVDMMTSEQSAIDTCKKIRKKYSGIELPILVITEKDQIENTEKAFEAGANDRIPWPFESETIYMRAKNLISLKNSYFEALVNEAAFLQAQIKPHFIYNTLNTIVSYCYTDSKKAAQLLSNFSKYLRLTLDTDKKRMFITMLNEIDLVKVYLSIEQVRFEDRIHVHYSIDPRLMEKYIPPLLIQPLVENAIRHGLLKRDQGGNIFISVNEHEGIMQIIVRDDGVGIDDTLVEQIKKGNTVSKGISINNIIKRVTAIKGGEFKLESQVGIGTTVIVVLPINDSIQLDKMY